MTLDNITRSIAHLELLGIGSQRHKEFKSNLLKAMSDLRITHPISEVTDLADLLSYDISGIPALLINGRVVFQKDVPSVEDLKIVLGSILARPRKGLNLDQIVVPTDFSPAADNALSYAGRLAEHFAAHIQLVHIHQEVGALSTLPHMTAGTPELSRMKKDILQEKMERLVPEEVRSSAEGTLLTGNVTEQLRGIARQKETDLMVLGTTGEGGNRLDRIGSHASAIARKAECPVLLIPEKVSFQPYRRILFASKMLPGEESVWPKAVDLASRFGAEIHFVHIQDKELNGYHLGQAKVGTYPIDQEAFFRLATVQANNVIEGLSQYAEEQQADLLIMATTHRNFLQDLLHKSATHRMIFTTKIPLLVLHFSLPKSA